MILLMYHKNNPKGEVHNLSFVFKTIFFYVRASS